MIFLAKDLLKFAPGLIKEGLDISALNIQGIVRPVNHIPESKKINVLLDEFKSNRSHMANLSLMNLAKLVGWLQLKMSLKKLLAK